MPEMTKCPVCGEVFSQPKYRNKRYCSRKCSRIATARKGLCRSGGRPRNSATPDSGDCWMERVYDRSGSHLRFRQEAMRREPWKYEFAVDPALIGG